MSASIKYLASDGDTALWPAGATLHAVIVGTSAGSTVVTVYDGTTNGGTVRATINGAAAQSVSFHGARFPDGVFVEMIGGDGKVSVIAE